MLVPASRVSNFEYGTPKAMREAHGMGYNENTGPNRLETQMTVIDAKDVIYVYNLTDFEKVVEQPPSFPHFVLPARAPGERFGMTMLPRFVRDTFMRAGTTEFYYAVRDGREAANSLMNPDAHPRNPWGAQTNENVRFGNGDQTGNNLNALGCFWSLTKPDDPALEKEIKLFADRYDRTMRALVNKGEELYAGRRLSEITPLMHRAMDHFNLQADWHRLNVRYVPCPNCGENVREGIAYHKNEFGERCIIDHERYARSTGVQKPVAAVIPEGAVEIEAPEAVADVSPANLSEKRLEDMTLAELATVAAGTKPAVKKKAGK